ncbi:hypothetical protein [Streptomyces sp. NPDC050504]|uniref:hypothetical protein n=1 Tax=Streptomyces sp. NPDC050504 TaxID=3365618 RepID=UPI00379851BB
MRSTRIRRGLAAALAVSALCLTAACGDSDDGGKKDGKTADKAVDKGAGKGAGDGAKPLTAAQMSAGVLALADLPEGWKADKPDTDEETAKVDKPECQALGGFFSTKVEGATMGSEAAFQGDGGGSMLSHQTFTFPGTGAADYVAAVGEALKTCTAFTLTQAGEDMKITVKKLAAPQSGEAAHAFRIAMDIPQLSMKFESDGMVAHQGTGAMRLTFTPPDASGHPAFDDLAKRAGEKFAKAVQG